MRVSISRPKPKRRTTRIKPVVEEKTQHGPIDVYLKCGTLRKSQTVVPVATYGQSHLLSDADLLVLYNLVYMLPKEMWRLIRDYARPIVRFQATHMCPNCRSFFTEKCADYKDNEDVIFGLSSGAPFCSRCQAYHRCDCSTWHLVYLVNPTWIEDGRIIGTAVYDSGRGCAWNMTDSIIASFARDNYRSHGSFTVRAMNGRTCGEHVCANYGKPVEHVWVFDGAHRENDSYHIQTYLNCPASSHPGGRYGDHQWRCFNGLHASTRNRDYHAGSKRNPSKPFIMNWPMLKVDRQDELVSLQPHRPPIVLPAWVLTEMFETCMFTGDVCRSGCARR